MSHNEVLEGLHSPPQKLSIAARITLDQLLHDYTHEERMFFAMQYAVSEYRRIEDTDYDITDYRIAADEIAETTDAGDGRLEVVPDE